MKYVSIFLLLSIVSCANSNKNQTLSNENSIPNKQYFDTTQLAKTAEMLDETRYWDIVDRSVKNTNNQEEQRLFLIQEIEKLTPKEMIGFWLRTDYLLYNTYTSNFWCAGYIMNGGCSDDGFEYFRNWVISRGKAVYTKAVENPDNLVSSIDKNLEAHEFEFFWYVALDAFKNVTGKDLYNYIDETKFKTNEANYQRMVQTWQEDQPESMKKICPQLYAALWPK